MSQNALDKYTALSPKDFARHGRVNNQIGVIHMILKKNTDALKAFKLSLDAYSQSQSDFKERIARVNHNIGMTYRKLSNPEEAFKHCREAVDMYRRVENVDYYLLAQALSEMNAASKELNDYGVAFKAYSEAIHALRTSKEGCSGESIAFMLSKIGALYKEANRCDDMRLRNSEKRSKCTRTVVNLIWIIIKWRKICGAWRTFTTSRKSSRIRYKSTKRP